MAGPTVQALDVRASSASFQPRSVVFGIAYCGVMPLYAILARDFFSGRILGTVFGAIAALADLGMALGPWASGLVYDAQASCAWLFRRRAGRRRGGAGVEAATGSVAARGG